MGIFYVFILPVIGEIFGTTFMEMGYQFSIFYELHYVEMMYAIMLLMGFSDLFIDRVLVKYAGNLIQKKGNEYQYKQL